MKRISLALFVSGLSLPLVAVAEPPTSDLTVTVGEKTMTRMISPWADYFGTHYASSPDEAGKTWNTVRSYGGTHVGIQAENPAAPARKGPFTGREFRFTLEDFHGPRGGKSAAQLIPELIQHRLTGIYIMTSIVRPSLEPFDKDRAYWAVRQIHEKFPEAHRHVVWQMGNELVSGHFDPKGVWGPRRGAEPGQRQEQGQRPGQREDNFFGYDLKWKEDYYVNDYLAPAIEATERASKDITEDHGHAGKGPVTILDRGLRFLAWAARNNLSGAQTRLCWWGENAMEPGGRGREATVLLGGFLAGKPLYFSHRQESDVNLCFLTDATDGKLSRGLVAIVPERFGALDCGKLTVKLPAGAPGKTWSARAVSYTLDKPPQISPVTLSRDGDSLIVPVNARVSGAWLLMFADLEAKEPALKGKLDAKRIGVGGHSFGANTAQLIGGAKAFLVNGEKSFAEARVPGAGLLYYAKAEFAFADNKAVITNPHICGAFFQVIWSEVEKKDGRCDWSQLDQWIEPWLKANKKVAIRMMWSTSGNWPKPYYKTPTPQWVWREGAKFAFHAASGTEIPLVWDPIYQKYAWRFLEQFAARYDNIANLLFVDVTPGAETNPYRFARINLTHPEFKDEFEKTKASDGRTYNEELWLETIKQWVDASDRIFQKTPLLVTLNVGGLRAADRSVAIGDYCVEKGFYVGQNGLSGRSYLDSSGGRTAAFHRWSNETKLFFEMVAGTGGRTGTLMEVMHAAERIGCSYLNVYPEDVLRGTRGQPQFDPEYEQALAYGARVLGGVSTQGAAYHTNCKFSY